MKAVFLITNRIKVVWRECSLHTILLSSIAGVHLSISVCQQMNIGKGRDCFQNMLSNSGHL